MSGKTDKPIVMRLPNRPDRSNKAVGKVGRIIESTGHRSSKGLPAKSSLRIMPFLQAPMDAATKKLGINRSNFIASATATLLLALGEKHPFIPSDAAQPNRIADLIKRSTAAQRRRGLNFLQLVSSAYQTTSGVRLNDQTPAQIQKALLPLLDRTGLTETMFKNIALLLCLIDHGLLPIELLDTLTERPFKRLSVVTAEASLSINQSEVETCLGRMSRSPNRQNLYALWAFLLLYLPEDGHSSHEVGVCSSLVALSAAVHIQETEVLTALEQLQQIDIIYFCSDPFILVVNPALAYRGPGDRAAAVQRFQTLIANS